MDAASEAGEWQRIDDAAQRVVDQCSADIRDYNIKMQRELNRRKGGDMIFYQHTDPSYLPSIFEKGLFARPWHARAR